MSEYRTTVEGKRVYPPMQWRPLRVMATWQKFLVLLGLLVASGLVARVLAPIAGLVPPNATVAALDLFWAIGIVVVARSFRGWEEPVAPPRAWWRLTARPPAGWALGILSLLSAASVLVPRGAPNPVDAVTNLLVGIAFINSSVRLAAASRR